MEGLFQFSMLFTCIFAGFAPDIDGTLWGYSIRAPAADLPKAFKLPAVRIFDS
jgi:hypothetical protein